MPPATHRSMTDVMGWADGPAHVPTIVRVRPWPAGHHVALTVRDAPGALATFRAGDTGSTPGATIHRVVAGIAVPWYTPTERFGLRVQFTPDTFLLPSDLAACKLLVQHDDERPVGFTTAARYTDTGLWWEAAVPLDGDRSATALADMDQRLRDGLSVGVELDADTRERIWHAIWEGQSDGEILTLVGTCREVSLVTLPQFLVAAVDHTASATHVAIPAQAPAAVAATAAIDAPDSPPADRPVIFTTGRNTMPPTLTTAAVPAGTDSGGAGGTPHPPALPDTMSLTELAAQLAPLMGAGPAVPHRLAGFGGLGDFLVAAREGAARDDAGERVTLALADQITANNPGVLPPTWLTEVQGIIGRGRPAIAAFGGPLGAGDSGMTINWPYYDGDLETLVDQQAAEKTEVTTGRVDIKSANAALRTYAGASDISYQLLRRSSPSYREIYSRILTLAWAARTDKAFSVDITAAGVDGPTWDGATVESLNSALFAASEQVEDATGVPASIALVAPDVFALIGSGLGLLPPAYGTSNVAGVADASTLRVEVSGLAIRKGRHLAAGTFIVSAPEVAKWREDGPYAVEADDVALLGRDVGIWGMGTTTVFVPAGLVKVTSTPVLPFASTGDGDTESRARSKGK